MPTIAENRASHPEWFVDPASVTGDVRAILEWKAKQPFGLSMSGGTGTIGDAWETAGTGMFYAAHVRDATEQLADFHKLNARLQADGIAPNAPFWLAPTPAAVAPVKGDGSAVFGGS